MKKRIFVLSVLLTLSALLFAVPVDKDRAKDVAKLFLQKQIVKGGQNRAPQNLRLEDVNVSQYDGKLFVFNTASGGFVVVSANDVAYPILGYSDENSLKAENIPSNVKAWLDLYAKEIQMAVDSGVVQSEDVMKAWSNVESYSNAAVIVSPLILTRWNQSPLYNNLCPMDNAKNERTVTGCVATAMAQVLKYWDYPVTGNGDYSYNHTLGTQFADFGATTYDWANMPLELTATSTDVQVAAVAQLMYHCGVSVEMDYGVSSTGGSGAFTISSKSNTTHCAEYALREYWGYKPTLQGLQKAQYNDADWKKMLKDDLKAGRPIIYSGYGDGGHCFVCDGYNEDEYFHFNWGWGGMYDGYFLLNALAPGSGGIGSGGGTYNNDQQAIFGVEPLRSIDGDESAKDLHLASTMSLSSSEIAYKEGFSVSASIKNGATEGFSGDLGLALYDSGLELLTIIDVQDTAISAGGIIDCTFVTEGWSELVAGLYYAAIYSKTASGEWKSIGGGSYRNMVQFRIKTDPCAGNMVYECDFENELLGWNFLKADGINTGFVVDTAMKYQGDKALYVSPDGGRTAGYTQDNDKGYVSVAYKKIYLEAGNYNRSWNYYSYLSYLDIDQDYCKIAIVPANNEINPLDYYEYNPSFLQNYVTSYTYSSNYNYWTSTSGDFIVTNTGNYYLVFVFIATDKITNQIGMAIDNISIIRKEEIKYRETLDGVLFEWTGGYSQYRIYWYDWCDYKNKYDTLNVNSYLIPYTKLRKAVYSQGMFSFYVTPICENGQQGNSLYISPFNVKTEPFPLDTCPAVPQNLKLEKTDSNIVFTWQGISGIYDFKYGTSSNGCSFIDTINSLIDTTNTLSYEAFRNSIDKRSSSFYFFVRGICENDTSIWRRYGSFSVQWPDACSSDICWAKPCDFYAQNTSEGIMLTWRGNANMYEIECRSEDEYYKRGNIYEYNDSNYVRFMANDSMYVIPYGVLSDTLYHIRVRAICGNDTSIWTDYISAYNINFGEYCIPFYDLCGPNTLCTYGGYSYPYSNKKTLDYRQKDWNKSYSGSYYRHGINGWTYYRSRHTICFEGEVDSHCDSLLTTVPPGEKYSMRLGNWYNGEGESVTYTHKIDSGYRLILLLKYAVVLQDPSHTSKENPHFTLEILDENDQLLDSECLYADFAADKNAEGWKNAVNAHEPTKEEFRNIVWKDWTTIGVNLSDLSQYGDRTIKIRLTTKDCTKGQHFGYAYFTLQCTSADMAGVKCAERPLYFEVAEGFKYRWYLMDDITKTSVWDQRRFEVAELDTNSYHVDMISLENENCFYTMNAYTLPRMPESKAEYKLTPHDCKNEVSFENKSFVYKIMLNGTHELDSRVVIDSVIWDFGQYGKSIEENPKIIVPNEGDTFNIKLRTVANGCQHIEEIEVKVPAIRDTTTYAHRYLCEGDTLLYCGREYYRDGIYVDTFARSYGCDSVHTLTVEYLVPEYKYYTDTICEEELPYKFFGKDYNVTGVYQHHVPSTLGCDTIIHELTLTVLPSLVVTIDSLGEFTRDDAKVDLSYHVTKGAFTGYKIDFSTKAESNGFVDIEENDSTNKNISIPLPKGAMPGVYTANVIFYNHDCSEVIVPIEFTFVLYSKPKSQATFDIAPHDCVNEVFITNDSKVYRHYTSDSVVLDLNTPIDSVFWNFGVYGTSTEFTPQLVVPNEGDTFTVKLRTIAGLYKDEVEYVLEVPAIEEKITYLYAEICKGSKYIYEGVEYTAEGEHTTSRGKTIYGCDSTHILVISYLQPKIEELYDTICFGDLPYEFYGQKCNSSGEYRHTLKAVGGCDSIICILNLYVHEKLIIELDELAEICGDDDNFVIPYIISQGSFSSGELRFNQFALDAGFKNVVGFDGGEIVVAIPDSVRPDFYAVDVIFNNYGCETVTLPLEFTVLYPSSVIGQRWNDFLSVKNAQYNGGYTFIDYQWYLNDEPIDGYKATQIYEYGKELDFEGEYRVLLTRADDGKSIMSCPFIPVRYNEDEYTELSTLVYTNQIVVANASHVAKAKMYNVSGICVGEYDFEVGYNDVKMPSETGVYTMQIVYDTEQVQIIRIVVRQ